ncbi:hypothetical protein ABIF78_006685 [Bradyrhizobium japonicum]
MLALLDGGEIGLGDGGLSAADVDMAILLRLKTPGR